VATIALPDLGAAEATWALAHQPGHVLLHGAVTYPPGATTSGDACLGVRKAEVDAVAYIICARYGIAATGRLADPQIWVGTDPRAQPGAVILAVGERVTAAAAQISRHLDHALPSLGINLIAPAQQDTATHTRRRGQHRRADSTTAVQTPVPEQNAGPPPEPPAVAACVLLDAERFYISQLDDSWVPAYLHARGIGQAAIGEWRIGYAPAGWTTLTGHLHGLGHAGHDIQAAGLARRSSRGTLIDHFRDRVMLPVHDERGKLAGFTGRARPGARPEIPKYLNTPRLPATRRANCCSGCRPAVTSPQARHRSSWKGRSTPSRSALPIPARSAAVSPPPSGYLMPPAYRTACRVTRPGNPRY
jgi:hypothetical protein